jgi:hypothetical protein
MVCRFGKDLWRDVDRSVVAYTKLFPSYAMQVCLAMRTLRYVPFSFRAF